MTGTESGQGATGGLSRLPRQGDFWRLWLAGLMMWAARWIEILVVAIFTYEVTASAFLVTMMLLLRLLPMALFGAVMGAWADRMDRRLGLLFVLSALLLTSVALAALAWSGRLEVWHIALSSFINGTAWATDNPLRRIMMGEVVGVDRMASAMALDSGANNACRIIGPALGGFLFAAGGIQTAFSLNVGLYVVGIAALFGLARRKQIVRAEGYSVLRRLAEGIREVRQRRHLLGILVVTAIYNLFGWPFHSLVPVIGKDTLGLDAEGIGLLTSMDGVGAMMGAAWIILLAKPRHFHTIYVGAVAVFLLMIICFGMSGHRFVSGPLLLATGMSSACFAVMQTTLIYRAVAPEMRSRMLGMLSFSIGVGPIGFLQVGWLAEMFGAQPAIIILAIEGLVALALTWPLWRLRGDG